MSAPTHEELRRALRELAADAGRALRRARRRTAGARVLRFAFPFLALVPAVWLGLRLAARAAGGGLEGVGWWWIALAAAAVPLAAWGVALLVASWQRIERRDALYALDRALDLDDRLLSADELLDVEEESPFVAAALEDAHACVPRARGAQLALSGRPWRPGRREAWIAAAAALLLLVSAWIGMPAADGPGGGKVVLAAVPPLGALETTETSEPPPPPPDEPAPRDEAGREPAPPRAGAGATPRRDPATKLSEEVKESVGLTREGLSADAESQSGASQSRGMPSNQSQESKPSDKPAKKDDKKAKPRPPADLREDPKKSEEEDSGSTAGKGSSKGSNKNPVVSRWSSKDQVTTQDDQEIEEDEDAEDEEEDQEARGGIQPHLRDRKPPVSRDLRIGFGNRPDPDANGRGGPSEMKKSRGTASLVLGVPIPDRVKGQPNPGKTKITQERIEPSREESDPVDATARRPREAPVGHLARPELVPWMRTLVRDYFLTLRQRTDGS